MSHLWRVAAALTHQKWDIDAGSRASRASAVTSSLLRDPARAATTSGAPKGGGVSDAPALRSGHGVSSAPVCVAASAARFSSSSLPRRSSAASCSADFARSGGVRKNSDSTKASSTTPIATQ